MSKGDIFPVNNNAIDDNNFPRYRSTYCDFSIEMKYTANIYFMCKYPKYDTNMLKKKRIHAIY